MGDRGKQVTGESHSLMPERVFNVVEYPRDDQLLVNKKLMPSDFNSLAKSIDWFRSDFLTPEQTRHISHVLARNPPMPLPPLHTNPALPLNYSPIPMPNYPHAFPLSFPHIANPFVPQNREIMDQNRNKYMMLLDATQGFCAGEWKNNLMSQICNGVQPLDVNQHSIDAAEFAISFLNQSREEGITLKQVIRVNWQYLRCNVYWLTMEGSDDKFYESVVLVSYDMKEYNLKYIRPARFFPQIPSHLHYLTRP